MPAFRGIFPDELKFIRERDPFQKNTFENAKKLTGWGELTSPGNVSLLECSVGLGQLDSEEKKTLHWKCRCSSGKRRMGNSWKKSWLGTPLETEEVSSVLTPHILNAPHHLPLGWRNCCHHLAQVTKSLGKVCVEAFASSNFHAGMKSDQHTPSAPASCKIPLDLLR